VKSPALASRAFAPLPEILLKKLSPRVSNLVPYQPGKPIDEVKRELGIVGDVVKLASNENPLGPSPSVQDALSRILSTLALYPDGACHDLRQAVAQKLGVGEDCLIFGNGSDEIIHLLGLSLLEEGDEVVVGDPTFVLYEAAATLAGATTVKIPLTRPDYVHDVDGMIAAFTPKTRLVFIANPHNPTGSVIGKNDVAKLLAHLPERAILVLDEAYVEYAEDDPDFPSALTYIQSGAPVISLRTFSKMYGLAGLRVGYGMAHPAIIAALNQPRSPFNVNIPAQVAAVAALADDDWIAESKRVNSEGMAQIIVGANQLGLSTVPSKANFILVDTKRPAKAMFDALLKRGVIVRAFPSALPTFLRVTVGTRIQNERFLAVLGEAIAEIEKAL
jgi:histidinol-phosphate aminotransferase